MQDRVMVYCDGACLPDNPGGYGCWAWVAYLNGREINHAFGCLGHGAEMTNNRAEYTGVVEALRRAKTKGQSIDVRADSQLVVKQVLGEWSVHAAHLRQLCAEAAQLLHDTKSSLAWVRREANTRADYLTKLAYEQALSKELPDGH
jgi:ribonuclease HI